MLSKRIDLWLPSYVLSTPYRLYQRIARASRHTHLIFLVCDHFEPRHGVQSEEQPFQRMRAWRTGYAEFQRRCRSEFGVAPLHTWFYPPHHGGEHLADLAAMAHAGMGEVELHYHHHGDSEATLERDLRATLAEYNRWGLLLASGEQPRTSFGFIHGDWALANSCGGEFCGVNDELAILQRLGCWADLTMPSSQQCQTRKINSIYYATGNPHRPKSHDWGTNARVGAANHPGLMLIQGPLGLNWAAPSYPRIENASLTDENWGRPDRIRKWIDCQVHVRGRPEWLFIKLHTHGAVERDFDALFGDKALQMHRVLNRDYNDGKRFSLHYVTARQAYNIAKAAEAGHAGDPASYVDFAIAPPATASYAADARHTLEHCSADHLKLTAIESGRPVAIECRVGPIASARGPIAGFEVDARNGQIHLDAAGSVELKLRPDTPLALTDISGAARGGDDAAGNLRLSVNGRCTLGYRCDQSKIS